MHEYRFDETNHLCCASANPGSVIPGAPPKMVSPESITLAPWLWIPGSPFSRHPGMTPLMSRICGSTFTSSQDGRLSRPEAAATLEQASLPATTSRPPTKKNNQPTKNIKRVCTLTNHSTGKRNDFRRRDKHVELYKVLSDSSPRRWSRSC